MIIIFTRFVYRLAASRKSLTYPFISSFNKGRYFPGDSRIGDGYCVDDGQHFRVVFQQLYAGRI